MRHVTLRASILPSWQVAKVYCTYLPTQVGNYIENYLAIWQGWPLMPAIYPYRCRYNTASS
ncbi:uncharacterized protein PgNI_09863 [Pyricularia grisea]|uniref:Uncharacterized protein n=1 Tax=Pyricularia grisea TaxID=148305 RepID=A0A6P8ATX8_PYRGI|nr:uncharacterized protein PgNI_09863 [Pyricularia grisea]TLD05575.1 hypothetical protein PgNI_09863 [Pyricularia grisea]